MKKILLTLLLAAPAALLCAQNVGKGGITPEMLQEIRKAQPRDCPRNWLHWFRSMPH